MTDMYSADSDRDYASAKWPSEPEEEEPGNEFPRYYTLPIYEENNDDAEPSF